MNIEDHVTIVRGTSAWGAPTAEIRFDHPEWDHFGRSCWFLTTPAGMPNSMPTRSDGSPWTYSVYRTDNKRRSELGVWSGATESVELEAAIAELLATVAEWESGAMLRERIGDTIYHLRQNLQRLVDDETPGRTANVRAAWPDVETVFAELRGMLYEPPPPRPVPPLHPWASIAGHFNRPTVDNRLWEGGCGHRLTGRRVPLFDGERSVGWVNQLTRVGNTLWAFGLSLVPQIADELNGGTMRLGVGLVQDEGDIEIANGLFRFKSTVAIGYARVCSVDSWAWHVGEEV